MLHKNFENNNQKSIKIQFIQSILLLLIPLQIILYNEQSLTKFSRPYGIIY